MILSMQRILKTAYQHIVRNMKLSLASVLIMALTFLISSIFLIALFGANLILTYFEGQSQIIVFFNPDTVTTAYIQQVENAVMAENLPVHITEISKEEAYKIFVSYLNQQTPAISQSVNENKLPPSIEVRTTNIDDLEKVATLLYSYQAKSNSIDNILYYKNVENFLNEFIKVIRLAAIVFISFLGSISVLIVWITIGIALNSHADDIEVMQLVGGTKIYIETPYILEGAIYGITGAIASSVIVAIVYEVITHFYTSVYASLTSYFRGIPTPHITFILIFLIVLGEAVLGALIGAIGSYLAIRSKLR